MSVKHGGDIYQYNKEVIDFSSNINPLGPPKALKELFTSDLEHITRYPDRSYKKLRQAIAGFHEVSPEQIMVGNGAAEIIYILGQLFSDKKAVVPEPTFSEYSHVLEINGGTPITVHRKPSQGFPLPQEKLAANLSRASGVFLCRPNNPAGKMSKLEELTQILPADKLIISDESFLDFVPEGEDKSLLSRFSQWQNLIVLRSATKFFALPGLRLGYAVASRSIIEKLEAHQPPWSVNSLACRAGRIMYEQENFRSRTLNWVQKERNFLQSKLDKLEAFTLFPGEANFFLLKIDNQAFTSAELKQEIIKHDILIRDAASFTGLDSYYFRVAVKTREKNEKLLSALATAADKLDSSPK